MKEKPNNMGIYLGKVSSFNNNKGYVKLTLDDNLEIGDTVSFEKEIGTYTVSELMKNRNNITLASKNDFVEIGRMKGNINIGDKIYKISSKNLSSIAANTFSGKELKKVKLNGKITIKKNLPIIFDIEPSDQSFYKKNIKIKIKSDLIPVNAINSPTTKDRIEKQINKTTDTPFEFNKIEIDLDNNLFISPISALNEIRRNAINQLENMIIEDYIFDRSKNNIDINKINHKQIISTDIKPKISLLLNNINKDFDYSKLENIDKLYLPISVLIKKENHNAIKYLNDKFNTYIYMPLIIQGNFVNIIEKNIENILDLYNIKGFVISNLGQIEMLKEYKDNYEFIGNYSLNIFNSYTTKELEELNIKTVTLSPELNSNDLINLSNSIDINKELIVYGNLPVMTSKYCLLGKTNKCYSNCNKNCITTNKYYLKDRLGLKFKIIPDSSQTITTIYNSKTTSISYFEYNLNSVRIDILDENIEEINNILNHVKSNKKLEGNNYTNGNLNKTV